MRAALAIPLVLAACVTPQVYVTEIGPLQVVVEDDLVIANTATLPDGSVIEPFPQFGGLAVRTLNGRPVPFEGRDAAFEAMAAYCADSIVMGAPLWFGWRAVGDEQLWTAAGCEEVQDDLSAFSGAE